MLELKRSFRGYPVLTFLTGGHPASAQKSPIRESPELHEAECHRTGQILVKKFFHMCSLNQFSCNFNPLELVLPLATIGSNPNPCQQCQWSDTKKVHAVSHSGGGETQRQMGVGKTFWVTYRSAQTYANILVEYITTKDGIRFGTGMRGNKIWHTPWYWLNDPDCP